jgi:hypothetical protein
MQPRGGEGATAPSADAPPDGAAAATRQPYYWEDDNAGTPTPIKLVTDNLHWLTSQLVTSVEYVGEMFADFFGLFNSRYEWAVQAERQREAEMERQEEEERREEQRARWALIQQMNAAGGGRPQEPPQGAGAAAATAPAP